MKRREFITLLGGAAAWPLAARAQQGERMRRVSVLFGLAADDPETQARHTAFVQGLQELGWTDGRNVRIDTRWGAGDADRVRRYVAELVALAPDAILATGTTVMGPLQRATRTVPIVFVNVADPVGAGLVASLAQPGGNATGFAALEYGSSGKWLELLKQIAPDVSRAAVVRDPTLSSGSAQFGAIQAVSPFLGMNVSPVDAREPGEIERAMTAFASEANGGVVVTISTATIVHRERIITLAARHRLPAVFPYRLFVASGGLISYGPDSIDSYRRAAGYIDRILKGEKPADLPVIQSTKFQFVINMQTARALGLEVPPQLLASADEVIE
jgi:ABC-type uncharacterized transport system substrate-binding protein